MPDTSNDYAGILDEVIAVCASVSAANLARHGVHLPATRVDPFALRRLADHIERVLPGAIETERAAHARRMAATRDAIQRKRQQVREAGERAAAQSDNVDADPQCPHGCNPPLRWTDDQYICPQPDGCGDEWDYETIHGRPLA